MQQPATRRGRHVTSWICGEAVASVSEYPLRRAKVRPSPLTGGWPKRTATPTRPLPAAVTMSGPTGDAAHVSHPNRRLRLYLRYHFLHASFLCLKKHKTPAKFLITSLYSFFCFKRKHKTLANFWINPFYTPFPDTQESTRRPMFFRLPL